MLILVALTKAGVTNWKLSDSEVSVGTADQEGAPCWGGLTTECMWWGSEGRWSRMSTGQTVPLLSTTEVLPCPAGPLLCEGELPTRATALALL